MQKKNKERAVSFVSMGQLRYLSVLQFVDATIGNSSSGIIEVSSFGKPTVNIGDRQKGRIKAESVIDSKPKASEIKRSIARALNDKFRKFCATIKNPYGDGQAAEKIIKILKLELNKIADLKKEFYDLPRSTIRKSCSSRILDLE